MPGGAILCLAGIPKNWQISLILGHPITGIRGIVITAVTIIGADKRTVWICAHKIIAGQQFAAICGACEIGVIKANAGIQYRHHHAIASGGIGALGSLPGGIGTHRRNLRSLQIPLTTE